METDSELLLLATEMTMPPLQPMPPEISVCFISQHPLRRPVELAQFRSRKVLRVLARHGLLGSMGRVGAAGDIAAMGSFFALLQKNVLDRRRWATRAELRIAIVTWIERTYHRRRRQARLGRLTPIEFETIMTTQVALAA